MALCITMSSDFGAQKHFSFLEILFTCISAFATVGFDIGVTQHLSMFGQFILIIGMFVGRLGILLLLSALWQALYKSRIDRQKRIGLIMKKKLYKRFGYVRNSFIFPYSFYEF